jgi:putative membrane protein
MLSFTDVDRERIRQTVQQAELRTTGEIVPMIVPSSARYRDAGYRTGLILGWLVLTLLLTLDSSWFPWGWHGGNAGWLLLAVMTAYGAGEWLGTLPAVIRLVTSRERMAYKVQLRAEQAFYHHGLQSTQGRTAILIMVSLLEHRVHVLADKGINDCVAAGTWDDLVHGIIEGIRAGKPTDAICAAIVRCGDLLAQQCPARPGENPNELPDRLIQES